MNELSKDYKKYKWFFTSSGKLVIGGKSSSQNDELLAKAKQSKQEYILMHTSSPGSPFTLILSSIDKTTKEDIKECAIFTASFSKAWKEKKKKAEVHVFKTSQVYKTESMNQGTWGVRGLIEKLNVPLVLFLTKQKDTLRAVPEQSIRLKSEKYLKILPGSIDKQDILAKIQFEIPNIKFTQEEILSALPAGGVKITKWQK